MASGTDQDSGTTKKAPAKKQPAKKQPTKKTSATKQPRKQPVAPRQRTGAPRAESRPRPSASEIGKRAVSELSSMTGNSVEGVSGLERTEDGWNVEVVVVELRRVPDTTDVLATYEVTLDASGELMGYRRMSRYSRGDTRSEQ